MLAAVLAVAFSLDRRELTPAAPQGHAVPAQRVLAALPAAATPAALPFVTLAEDEVERLVPAARLLRAPHLFRGRLFTCVNSLESLPVLAQEDAKERRFHPLRLSMRCRDAAGPAPALDRRSAERRRQRERALDGRSPLLHVRFDRATVVALPAVGRGAEVLLQALGTDAVGTPVARFVRLLRGRRVVTPLDEPLPDLLGMLVGSAPVGRARCASVGVAKLRSRAADAPSPQIFAQVRCRDRRGVPVSMRLRFADATQGAEALQIQDGTIIDVRVRRAKGSLLMADFEGLEAGAGWVAEEDLRRVLLNPKPWLGKRLTCESMGLPPPLVVGPRVLATLPKERGELSDRRAWVVCRQVNAPPVHLNLLLGRGEEPELLRIGRGTRLHFDVLGATDSHLDGRLASVGQGALPAAEHDGDLRRYVLLSSALRGQRLRCTLAAPLLLTSGRGDNQAAREARAEAGNKTARQAPQRAQCVDSRRPLVGQTFLLRFGRTTAARVLPKGTTLQLRFDGVRDALPLASVLKVSPASRRPLR